MSKRKFLIVLFLCLTTITAAAFRPAAPQTQDGEGPPMDALRAAVSTLGWSQEPYFAVAWDRWSTDERYPLTYVCPGVEGYADIEPSQDFMGYMSIKYYDEYNLEDDSAVYNNLVTEYFDFHGYQAILVSDPSPYNDSNYQMQSIRWDMGDYSLSVSETIKKPLACDRYANAMPLAEALYNGAVQNGLDQATGQVPGTCSALDGLDDNCNPSDTAPNGDGELCPADACPDYCDGDTSYYDGICDSGSGECSYYSSPCESGCDPYSGRCIIAATPTPGTWDLAVRSMSLIQSIEGTQLAAWKPTALRVLLDWNDPSEVVLADVSIIVDGTNYQTLRHTVKTSYSDAERQANQDAVIFHLPGGLMSPGNHTFVVQAVLQLQSDQMYIEELDETNNMGVLNEVNVRDSRPLRLLMQSTHADVGSDDIWRFVQQASPHLQDVYPISSVEILPTFVMLRNVYPDTGFTQVVNMAIKRQLYNAQLSPGMPQADYSVGLFPDGHYGSDVFGLSYPISRRNVLVGDGSSNPRAHEALPHEIGHDLLGGIEEYEIAGELEPGFYLPETSVIYKGHAGQLEDLSASGGRYVNFMGEAGGNFATWVNQQSWGWLYDALDNNSNVGMSGIPAAARSVQYPNSTIGEEQVSGYLVAGWMDSNYNAGVDTLLYLDNLTTFNAMPPHALAWVQGIGWQGEPLDIVPFEIDFSLSDPAPFSVVYPAAGGEVARLNLLFNGEVVWYTEASGNAPQVDISAPTSDAPLTGSHALNWQAADSDNNPLNYTVLYSPDNGATWLPLAAGLSDPTAALNTDQLPGCDNCLLRVLASDGLNTSSATSANSFAMADKAPRLSILSPTDGTTLQANQPLTLSASAFDLEDGLISGDQIVWQSDQSGELGRGDQLVLAGLPAASHIITATASDSRGATAQAAISLQVIEDNTQNIDQNDLGYETFGDSNSDFTDDIDVETLLYLLGACGFCGISATVLVLLIVFVRRRRNK